MYDFHGCDGYNEVVVGEKGLGDDGQMIWQGLGFLEMSALRGWADMGSWHYGFECHGVAGITEMFAHHWVKYVESASPMYFLGFGTACGGIRLS